MFIYVSVFVMSARQTILSAALDRRVPSTDSSINALTDQASSMIAPLELIVAVLKAIVSDPDDESSGETVVNIQSKIIDGTHYAATLRTVFKRSPHNWFDTMQPALNVLGGRVQRLRSAIKRAMGAGDMRMNVVCLFGKIGVFNCNCLRIMSAAVVVGSDQSDVDLTSAMIDRLEQLLLGVRLELNALRQENTHDDIAKSDLMQAEFSHSMTALKVIPALSKYAELNSDSSPKPL